MGKNKPDKLLLTKKILRNEDNIEENFFKKIFYELFLPYFCTPFKKGELNW
jgi:hypothetical protein